MRAFRSLLLTAVLAALAAAAASALAAAPAPQASSGRVIVGFKPQALTQRRAAAALRARGPEAAAWLGPRLGLTLGDGVAISPQMQVLTAPPGLSAHALAERLRREPDVAFAVVDRRRHALAAPNDPLYPDGLTFTTPAAGQWALRAPTAATPAAIHAEGAWARTRGSPAVVVAVLDSGILRGHPDLAGTALLPGYDFIQDVATANDGDGRDGDPSDPGSWLSAADRAQDGFKDCPIEDSSWHGTKVAGLIAATTDNAIGVAGVAPGVRLLPVRVLGKCGGMDSDILSAMRWAAGLAVPGVPANPTPAQVINLSLGGGGSCNGQDAQGSSYQSVVDELTQRGVVVVAAAGNEGGPVNVPASCPGVIGVGALAHSGAKAGYANLGPQLALSAPGGDCTGFGACDHPLVMLTNLGTQAPAAHGYTDGYTYSLGTSFSAPLVAGTVALMRSVNAGLTPAGIASALRGTAAAFPVTGAGACQAPGGAAQTSACDCTPSTCGAGMLDAAAAVAAATQAVTTHITASTPTPTVGSVVALDGSASVASPGRTVAGYAWALTEGADKAAFVGGVSGASAQLQVSAVGTVTVQLTVTDDQGSQSAQTLTLTVAAAPTVPDAPGASGGGLFGPLWGALLALGVACLPRPRGRRRAA